MTTKETKRRPPDRRRTRQQARSRTAIKEERRKQTAANRQRTTQQRRVVKAPKEDIPKVVYTPPKPLRRSRLILRLASMAAVAAAVIMCLSVFFKVDTVLVAGTQQYTPWMVREASGIDDGDSLLLLGEARVAGKIKGALPYVDQVKVTVSLPGTVKIEITEFPVSYAIEDETGGWWLITSDGAAKEKISSAVATEHTRITGLKITQPELGQQVRAAVVTTEITGSEGEITTEILEDQTQVDQKLEALLVILRNLEANQIVGDVISLDMTDLDDIRLQYSQFLSVRLGDNRQLEHKISYMASAIAQLDEYQSGELDLTFEYSDSGLFNPDNG